MESLVTYFLYKSSFRKFNITNYGFYLKKQLNSRNNNLNRQ